MERRIGPYLIEGELGRGGLSVVHRARAPDGTSVALKVLTGGEDPQLVLTFARERRLQAQLGAEAGFVPLLDAGQDRGVAYLVMPLLGGGDLRQRLKRGPLPPAEALALVGTLASAIGRAHQAGIVHRDLKPENVLFDDLGRPFVADLGLAKHFHGLTVRLTATGTAVGTPGYMPLEQLQGSAEVGPAADVFALGVLLFECLSGSRPFPAGNALEYVAVLASGRAAPSLRDRGCRVAEPVEEVARRALSREATARYPHAGAMAAALSAAAAFPTPRASSRRTPLLVGLVLLLAGGGLLLRSRPPSSPPTPAPPAATWTGFAITPADEWTAPPVHGRQVNEAAVRPDGRWALTTSEDGLVVAWDLSRPGYVAHSSLTLRAGEAASGAAWDPRFPDRAWVAGSEGKIRLLQVAEGEPARWTGIEVAAGPPSEGRAWRLVAGPDGTVLAGMHDGRVLQWRLETPEGPTPLARTIHEPTGPLEGRQVYGVASAPEDDTLAWGGERGVLVTREGGHDTAAHPGAQITALRFVMSGERRRLLVATVEGLELFDPVGRSRTPLGGHLARVNALAVFAGGRGALSGGWDGGLLEWDFQTAGRPSSKELVRPRPGQAVPQGDWINAVGCDADGQLAMYGTWAGRAAILARPGDPPRKVTTAHAARVVTLATLDRERVLSATADGSVFVWDAAGTVIGRRRYPNEWRAVVPIQAPTFRLVGIDGDGRLLRGEAEGPAEPWSPDPAFEGSVGLLATRTGPPVAFASGSRLFFGRVWGEAKQLGTEEGDDVSALAVGAEGALFWATRAGRLSIWFPGERTARQVLERLPGVVCLAAGPGDVLLAGSEAGTLTLLRGPTNRLSRQAGQGGRVEAVAFDPTGARAASIDPQDPDGRRHVSCWDLPGGFVRSCRMELPAGDAATSLLFVRAGELLVGTERGRILRYAVPP